MIRPMGTLVKSRTRAGIVRFGFVVAILALCGLAGPSIGLQHSYADEVSSQPPESKESKDGLSWEMPGRVSIYDLQFGPAVLVDHRWKLQDNSRTFNAGASGDRLTLMVRFSYSASQSDIPLKFVVKLPDSRQYEETIHLESRRGNYSYTFTIHRPEDFLGAGSVYLYYGFSIVDVLDFTIVPGS